MVVNQIERWVNLNFYIYEIHHTDVHANEWRECDDGRKPTDTKQKSRTPVLYLIGYWLIQNDLQNLIINRMYAVIVVFNVGE